MQTEEKPMNCRAVKEEDECDDEMNDHEVYAFPQIECDGDDNW